MDVHLIPTPRDDEVDHVPVSGTRMHPSGLAFILLLEQCTQPVDARLLDNIHGITVHGHELGLVIEQGEYRSWEIIGRFNDRYFIKWRIRRLTKAQCKLFQKTDIGCPHTYVVTTNLAL